MAKTKFRPLHDRVVVKRIDADERTKGGIIIPDTAKEKPSQGEVIAVGPGGRDESGKLRGQDRRPGAPDHEGVRHHGHHRRAGFQEESRVTQTRRHSRPAATAVRVTTTIRKIK